MKTLTYRSSWKDAMEDVLEEEPEEASCPTMYQCDTTSSAHRTKHVENLSGPSAHS